MRNVHKTPTKSENSNKGSAFIDKSDVSDTVNMKEKSRDWFSHCNQQKADKMRQIQHVSEHPFNATLIYTGNYKQY